MTQEPRPVGVGVVGLGRAFTLMLPTFLGDARVRLVAACDPREQARAQFAADFGAPTFETVEDLAAHPDVEIVYVASPHQWHAANTQAAAARGKHVLVEKPMALSLADCDAMIEHCRAAGVRLIVGHSHSFDSPYLRARALIQGGSVGAVKMITAFNYTDFLYRPRRPEELVTEAGGGVVFSQAAHQVDVVRLLADSPVRSVRAVTGNWDAQRPTEGAYSATLSFENGAFATLTYSGYGHFDSDEWCDWVGELGHEKSASTYGIARRRLRDLGNAGAEATLKNESTYGGRLYTPQRQGLGTFHNHFGPVIASCEKADIRPLPKKVCVYRDFDVEVIDLPPVTVPRQEVIDEVVAVVRRGEKPLHDGEWARSTLAVCLAILQSARAQQDVAPAA